MNNQDFIKLFNSMEKNDEFEISFLPKVSKLTLDKYITLLKYFSSVTDYKITTSDTLNVSYNYDFESLNNYRITIDGFDNIQKAINSIDNIDERENHIIFSLLHSQYKTKKDASYLSMIDKVKSKSDIIDIEKLGVRVRKATEKTISKDKAIDVPHTARKYVNFRFIQRASLIIQDNDDYTLRVDLSYVKSSNKINLLENRPPIIELEIDMSFKKSISLSKKPNLISMMNTTYNNIQKILQKSDIIMNKEEQNETIIKMNNLLFPDKETNLKDLPGMQSVAAEITHVVDIIPNNYCVTDKADGDRYFMFIFDGKITLLSNTLEVKEIKAPKGTEKFNDTILDGEYIFNNKYQKFVFLPFDCLIYKGEDKRNEKMLMLRLDLVKDVVKNLFGQKNIFEKYSGDFSFDKMEKYYTNDMKKHMDELNSKLEKKDTNIVSMKYFIFPQGVNPCEIFFYTALMWKLYTNNSDSFVCPYSLDGCIWTPLEQIYTRNLREQKFKIYKFKPSKFNSLDLYITKVRDNLTGQVVTVFDDSESNIEAINMSEKEIQDNIDVDNDVIGNPKGKMYIVTELHVGKIQGNVEYPALFQEDQDHHYANIYLENGEPRDIEGNIIQDKTVVEFIYLNDPLIKQGFRWVPLRTRYDKTESVNTFKRKYGNNSVIADKTWRSMIDGIEITDIELLGNPTTYEEHNDKLRSKMSFDVIAQERREDKYYAMISNLASGLKEFHNYIKSSIITIYCGPKNKEKMDVLEYGCGVGGDNMKYIHARIKSYTGFDVDEQGIYSGSNGAISRYQKFKKKFGVIGFNMDFFVADGGVLLNSIDQEQALGKIKSHSLDLIKKLFDVEKPKKYDIISCQFVVHYFFKNDTTLNNFMINVDTLTKPSAYVLLTTFDDEKVDEGLQKGDITSYYTTDSGEKKIIFDVKKKYEGKMTDKTGQTIDIHLPVFDEGVYMPEYIVPKKLLINKMKEKGFKLVETDLFENTFNKHKYFFDHGAHIEEKESMKSFLMKVKAYYDNTDLMNKSCYQYTFLNRYYIFQKETNLKIHKEFSTQNKFVFNSKKSKK